MEECIRELTDCSICLDIIKEPKALSCLHTFCNSCINKVARRNRVICCPYCKAVSAVKDLKDDFKIKELIQIRLNQNKKREFSAEQQAHEQLKNLEFLKQCYRDHLDYITAENHALEFERIEQLDTYKRKWADAFERECDIAKEQTHRCIENDDARDKVEQKISDIDTAMAEVEELLVQVSGTTTVEQTNRFSEKLAELSRHFPPKAPTVKLPEMKYLSQSEEEIQAQAHSCFTGSTAGQSSSAHHDVTASQQSTEISAVVGKIIREIEEAASAGHSAATMLTHTTLRRFASQVISKTVA